MGKAFQTDAISLPFHFDVGGVAAFLKADSVAAGGQRRRIGGLITTSSRDRCGDVVLQDGLDFSLIKQGEGYFIDEHNPSAGAAVGVVDPDSLRFYRKGAKLPDGRTAPNDGWWVEGDLLRNKSADSIWDAATSLEEFGRALGFSVDGRIHLRTNGKKTIAHASVHDIAITRHPMNPDARLVVLAKSLEAARMGVPIGAPPYVEMLAKAMSAGEGIAIPEGPVAGNAGGGRLLAGEDLGQRRKRRKKRAPTRGDLAKALLERWSWAEARTVGRLVDALYA